ncbi:hypothetical protein HAX54_003874 [Datura stramonium]|uniref:Uncharacterized protein n=1 Tax=Datura stramonium TaxID=4076 RepID=A0ABS8T784_DATST|nr:hypothetical protein [Datura stramonium]
MDEFFKVKKCINFFFSKLPLSLMCFFNMSNFKKIFEKKQFSCYKNEYLLTPSTMQLNIEPEQPRNFVLSGLFTVWCFQYCVDATSKKWGCSSMSDKNNTVPV